MAPLWQDFSTHLGRRLATDMHWISSHLVNTHLAIPNFRLHQHWQNVCPGWRLLWSTMPSVCRGKKQWTTLAMWKLLLRWHKLHLPWLPKGDTIHEGYRYKSQPWWRCKDCSYRTKLKSDQVNAITGEHNQTLQPSYAQASANTVILSMRKQAQEQSYLYHKSIVGTYKAV